MHAALSLSTGVHAQILELKNFSKENLNKVLMLELRKSYESFSTRLKNFLAKNMHLLQADGNHRNE